MNNNIPVTPAPLWRRLVAASYDTLLLAGLWLAAVFLAWLIAHALGTEVLPAGLVRAYLFLLSFVFFGWFWTHGGQTLGMRVWRIKVRRRDGSTLNWAVAMLRFAVAIVSWTVGGLGMLWCLIDERGRSWHDLAAGTEVIVLPKNLQA